MQAAIYGSAYAELQETVGDNFAAELLETFVAQAPGMLSDLRETAVGNDAEAFRHAGHSIKSNDTIFGGTGMADLARRLELDGVQAAAIDDLEAEYARATAALRGMNDGR